MLVVKNHLFAQDKTAKLNADVEIDTLYKDITTELDLRQTTGVSTLDIDRKQTLFGSDTSETGFELKGGNKMTISMEAKFMINYLVRMVMII